MNIKHLDGLIAAPFTPMHADGALRISQIPRYYEMLKFNGVNGAFICGSTGEGVSLSLKEKMEVAKAWADVTNADKDFNVLSFVGGTSITDCIELAKHSEQCGLYAVSFTSPFYFKPATVEMLAEACIAVGNAVADMPFYYYHIPVLTGVNFAMIDLLKALHGRLPNMTGIKYTHEDLMDFLSCINYDSGRYDMLWGRDESMLAALAVGARGAVGSTFNYAAPLYYAMIDAFHRNDFVKARLLQQQSIDMIRLLGKYGGIATGKAYMKLTGLDCGEFRLPVKNMSADDFQKFKSDTVIAGFDSFKSALP